MAQPTSSLATRGWVLGARPLLPRLRLGGLGGDGLQRAGMPQVYGWTCISLCQNMEKLLETGRQPPLNKKAVQALQVAGTHPLSPDAAGPGSSAVDMGVALLPSGVGQRAARGRQGVWGSEPRDAPRPMLPHKEFYVPPV